MHTTSIYKVLSIGCPEVPPLLRVVATIFIISVLVSCNSESPRSLPNVVIIHADDIGTGDISYYNDQLGLPSVLRTTAIDAIASEGMIFTNAHAATSLCAPSRYALMTGKYPFRSAWANGVWSSFQKSVIGPDDLTMARLMKRSDYNTAFFGKWHLGGQYYALGDSGTIYKANTHEQPDIEHIVGSDPIEMGFDYNFYSPAGIQAHPFALYENSSWYPLVKGSYIKQLTWSDIVDDEIRINKDSVKNQKRYVAKPGDSNWHPKLYGPLITQKAIEYIGQVSDTPNPFFLYFCSQAVHVPHTPGFKVRDSLMHNIYPSDHLNMIMELDEQVSRIIHALKDAGEYDNTLIIITSDNGGLEIAESRKMGHNANGPYRGSKGSIYEGGHRVPFIVSWPGHIKSQSQSDHLVVATDILATLATISDQPIPTDRDLDSFDITPLFYGDKSSRKDALIRDNSSKKDAYYSEGWKLIVDRKKQKPLELYNLKTDIAETSNLKRQLKATVVKRMLNSYKSLVSKPKK